MGSEAKRDQYPESSTISLAVSRLTYLPYTMELRNVFALLFLSACASAWKSFLAHEFTGHNCGGSIHKPHIGSRYWQVVMSEKSNSVFTNTPNNGIIHWYAFASNDTSGQACQGPPLGKLNSTCTDLGFFAQQSGEMDKRIRCVRWCDDWASDDDQFSCASFGAQDEDP
ncbi:hypothetical protein F4780DRAFT_759200 [Xylariomycetidae sp. FL0641]|nr:hypothetical protein F4780DRAFT_759200 [Xylariomycetidae sp. FL0641]